MSRSPVLTLACVLVFGPVLALEPGSLPVAATGELQTHASISCTNASRPRVLESHGETWFDLPYDDSLKGTLTGDTEAWTTTRAISHPPLVSNNTVEYRYTFECRVGTHCGTTIGSTARATVRPCFTTTLEIPQLFTKVWAVKLIGRATSDRPAIDLGSAPYVAFLSGPSVKTNQLRFSCDNPEQASYIGGLVKGTYQIHLRGATLFSQLRTDRRLFRRRVLVLAP